MKSLHWTLLVIVFATQTIAAPSDVLKLDDNISKLEDIAKVDKADALEARATFNEPLTLSKDTPANLNEPLTISEDTKDSEQVRQKRFFNYYGYGFPPMNPVQIYPNRDDPYQQYGYEDPIAQIYKRLQDIAANARNNYNYPQITAGYPVLFPVIYIPYVGCGCNPSPTPEQTPRPDLNNTDPGLSNRFPEMEDERQNWGFVVNETETDNEPEDFTRPISFEPIRPDRPMNRPPPAVDHGTNQAGNGTNTQTTTRPTTFRPTTFRPTAGPQRPNSPPIVPPTACDAAILSCCHQAQVTYDCFALQGCQDPSAYGNPCDAQVILRVIYRFQTYYGRRNG